ncbi:MAG: DUF45 domain-containing protein [Clostridia bacterium]|nr:DUF45 domain-containing protein [Clostridia bacterium]
MSIFRHDNNVIPYTVTKAIHSDFYIGVEAGEVVINAPWYFSKRQIRQMINEKKQWILSKMQEYHIQNNIDTERDAIYVLGISHQVHIRYQSTKTPTIQLVNKTIEMILPKQYKKLEDAQISKILIEKLYARIAEQEIERAMERARLLMGIAPEDYKIEKIKNKIAMCSTDEKIITIHPDIAMYNRDIIDYIVIHEFCHLTYKTHAKGFWKLLSQYVPNYERYEKMLQNLNH